LQKYGRLLALLARLVPAGEREGWLRLKCADLASLMTLIERGEMAVAGRAQVLRFLLEALAGAFWTRFSRDGLRLWRRTASFLFACGTAALAAEAVLSRGFWKTRFLVNAARDWQPIPPKGLNYNPQGDLLFAYCFPLAMAGLTGIILLAVGCRLLNRAGWRYWGFFAAKTAMLGAILCGAWIEGGAALRSAIPNVGARMMFGGLLLAFAFIGAAGWSALWVLGDQRRRCPVCLRRLEMPVRLGSWSSIFEPATTEFLCGEGHGSMSMPETEAAAGRWIALDASWRSLFGRERKQDKIPR
jgi:hypothetical protein